MRIDQPLSCPRTTLDSIERERSFFATRSMPAKPRPVRSLTTRCHAVRTRHPMATTTSCCTAASTSRRRLSDLLQEQQEPLLLLHLLLQADHDDDDGATPAPAAAARSLLRGTTRLARRWADDVLAGCFPRRQRLRRLLPRPGRDDAASTCAHAQPADDGAVGCGRPPQLSPVSVLDLLSHDVPAHRKHWPLAHSHTRLCNAAFSCRRQAAFLFSSHTVNNTAGDDDGKPSTPGNSPSPPSTHDHDHDHDRDLPGKTHTVEGKRRRFQTKSAALFASACREWESESESVAAPLSLAADSSWAPSLQVERDLCGSPRRDCWRRLVVAGEQEARLVARSVEAMIFEEVRWEAVRDMLSLPQRR